MPFSDEAGPEKAGQGKGSNFTTKTEAQETRYNSPGCQTPGPGPLLPAASGYWRSQGLRRNSQINRGFPGTAEPGDEFNLSGSGNSEGFVMHSFIMQEENRTKHPENRRESAVGRADKYLEFVTVLLDL